MGSPSPLARARAIFTAWEIYAKLEVKKKQKTSDFGYVEVTLFQCNLCSPVKSVVPEHLACYVEAFKDVESGDHRQSSMWGWGRHHMVTYRCTPRQQKNRI